MRGDFYQYVPKDARRNAEFRRKYIAQANDDPKLQEELWIMCSRDLLFWVNTFLWTVNQREHPSCPVRPFITWDFQDDVLRSIEDALDEKHDLVIEKSRDMGGTYLSLIPFLHRWQFRRGPLSFLLTSAKAELVDKPGDPKSLMWKLDFMLDKQPSWLRPKEVVRTEMHLENREFLNTIDGEASVEDAGRGGRYTGILNDEFAANPHARKILLSTQHAAYCRIFNSTCKGSTGMGGPFARLRKNPAYRKANMHWSRHPEKNRGLYGWDEEKNEPVVIDTAYRFPEGYQFQKPLTKEYPWRSPWYDNEVSRADNVMDIIQELDINDLDAGGRWFREDLVAAAEKLCLPALVQGMLLQKDGFWDDPVFEETSGGSLEIWVPLGKGRPPADRSYVVACDVAAGTDGDMSSNSVAVVIDDDTGEQVAQFTSKSLEPGDFADHAMSLGYFFAGRDSMALLNWEDNGTVGKQFRKRVILRGYGRLYRRKTDSKGWEKQGGNPGYSVQGKNKSAAFGELSRQVRDGLLLIRSAATVAEMREFVYGPNGEPVHDRALSAEENSSKGENHGDRVSAMAMAAVARRPKPRERSPAKTQERPEVAHGFYLGRVADRMKATRHTRGSRFSWHRR